LNHFRQNLIFVLKASCLIVLRDQEGKSGQQRASYFLTGRCSGLTAGTTDSATENKLPNPEYSGREKVKR
jgi:hypothetical protein